MLFSTSIFAVSMAASALASPTLLTTRDSCSSDIGDGTCQSTSSCGGFSRAGFCPGGADNQCCVVQTCSTSSGSGTCMNTDSSCGGSFVSGACPGDSSIQCCVAGSSPPSPPSGGGALPGLDDTQSAHAHAIMDEVTKEGLGRQGCLAALATGVVESSILVYANSGVPESLNYPHDATGSDHDSIGIFQQRASIYTNVAADMDPAQSAAQFFAEMKKIDGWQTMDVGTLCQKVQRSAYPDRYNDKGLPVAGPVCDAGGF